MPLDAAQIGYDRTLDALRKLLADRFGVDCQGGFPAEDPLFAIGVGLTSLEGIEFLCEVEQQFGVHIKDLDWWVYETPTLGAVAQYLVDLSKDQRPPSPPAPPAVDLKPIEAASPPPSVPR